MASDRSVQATEDPAAALHALLPGPPVLTLALAESVTCGRMQAAIGGLSGASAYLVGGITAYTAAQKVRHLGVPPAEAEQNNSVSGIVAAAMAIGACRLFGSDLAVATTGFAEPAPAAGFPEPGAFWAVAKRGASDDAVSVVRRGRCEAPGLGRVAAQDAIARAALAGLLDFVRWFRIAEAQSKFA